MNTMEQKVIILTKSGEDGGLSQRNRLNERPKTCALGIWSKFSRRDKTLVRCSDDQVTPVKLKICCIINVFVDDITNLLSLVHNIL